MSLIWADKIAETTTTTGTGNITLAGAITGYRAFSAVCATNDTFHYSITAVDANGVPTGDWEVGLGTYSASNTLTRTTVRASSNAGSAVSFSSGTKRVVLTPNAVWYDYSLGGYTTLDVDYTDGGNSGTTETDLFTYTVVANELSTNGDRLEAQWSGTFVSSGTATRQLRAYFGGTLIFDTGTLSISTSAAWDIYTTITRVSATVVRYAVSMTTQGAALAAYTASGEVTGLTLSSSNVFKLTGTAAGVGAASDDIVGKAGYVEKRARNTSSAGGALQASNNLSDVASKVASIDNLSVKGSDIASASTTDLSAATGDFVTVTGTTTITALGTSGAGVERTVHFSGALTLTHNATSLILPTGANITTASGDVARFRSLGSGNWRCIGYMRATGALLAADVQTFTGNGTWNKPSGAVMVQVIAIGGGGGGGSGASGAGTGPGGSGGGGGARVEKWFRASDLSSSETVTVGAGGAGGAGKLNGFGNPGAAGGQSSFGTRLTAYGGGRGWAPAVDGAASGGGGGGSAGGGATGATGADSLGGLPASTAGAAGLSGQGGGGTTNAAGKSAEFGGGGGGGVPPGGSTAGYAGGSAVIGAGGGGGGGGGSLSSIASGGQGGTTASYTVGGGSAGGGTTSGSGTQTGIAGTAGVAGSGFAAGGGGGGGGAAYSSTGGATVTGGAGGAGGAPGGGGGGSGVATVASGTNATSGAGGAGANGAVYVVTYF